MIADRIFIILDLQPARPVALLCCAIPAHIKVPGADTSSAERWLSSKKLASEGLWPSIWHRESHLNVNTHNLGLTNILLLMTLSHHI